MLNQKVSQKYGNEEDKGSYCVFLYRLESFFVLIFMKLFDLEIRTVPTFKLIINRELVLADYH